MTFRTKLTLAFSVLIAAIILILSLVIYFFAERYTTREFHSRLRERATIAAQLYLDEDELNASAFRRIRQRFLHPLPEEAVHVFDSQRRPAFQTDTLLLTPPPYLFAQIDQERYAEFTADERQWVGELFEDNQGRFYVLVSARDIYGQSKLENLQRVLLLSFVCSIGLVLLLGWVFAGQVLQPIGAIVQEVNQIRAANLHLRVRERSSHDEIAALTRTFNQMLDRLQASFDMQKSFISNASHELRNPLTAISGEIEVTLLKERTPAEYIRSLETLQKETDRLEKLTSDLLGLANTGFDAEEMQREAVRLDELLLECLAELKQTVPTSAFRLNLSEMPEEPEGFSISGTPSLLKIAVLNVLENAAKFSAGKAVEVQLQTKAETVCLGVQDQGIGIPEEDLGQIFQPFYRARNARGHLGTGIGLSLTHKIVRLHGGRINVESEEGVGTRMALIFGKG